MPRPTRTLFSFSRRPALTQRRMGAAPTATSSTMSSPSASPRSISPSLHKKSSGALSSLVARKSYPAVARRAVRPASSQLTTSYAFDALTATHSADSLYRRAPELASLSWTHVHGGRASRASMPTNTACAVLPPYMQALLASRDPRGVVAALLLGVTRSPSFLSTLLGSDGGGRESETVAMMLSACAAVALLEGTAAAGTSAAVSTCATDAVTGMAAEVAAPYVLPPWIRNRFNAATLFSSASTRRSASVQTCLPPDAATVAESLFRVLCRAIQSSRAGGNIGADADALWVYARLCAVCLATSEEAVKELIGFSEFPLASRAEHEPSLRLEEAIEKRNGFNASPLHAPAAVGSALASFCLYRCSTFSSDDCGATPETVWLRLWERVQQQQQEIVPRDHAFTVHLRALLHPTSTMNTTTTAAVVSDCTDSLPSHVLGWHLHCLLRTNQIARAGALLTQLCQPADHQSTREGGGMLQTLPEEAIVALLTRLVTPASAHSVDSSPVTTVAEDNLKLPVEGSTFPVSTGTRQAVTRQRLVTELAALLLERMRMSSHTTIPQQQQQSPPLLPPPQMLHRSHVPAVTKNVTLYAHMLDYILASLQPSAATHSGSEWCNCPSPSSSWSWPSSSAALADLQLLLASANVHALAASIVPSGQPLTAVMIASADAERTRKVGMLAASIRKVIEYLCSSSAGSTSASWAVQLCLSEQRRARQVETTSIRRRHANYVMREHQQRVDDDSTAGDVAEVTLSQAVTVLSALLALCASRTNSLPARRAEPRWRRELRATREVRTHKYQLLLPELPHADLSASLTALLQHGYLAEGSTLGGCLVDEQLMDLRFYSLYVLGSLFQAMNAVGGASSSGNNSVDNNTTGRACSNNNVSSNAIPAASWTAEKTATVMEKTRGLYMRRREVFGEELFLVPEGTHAHEAMPTGALPAASSFQFPSPLKLTPASTASTSTAAAGATSLSSTSTASSAMVPVWAACEAPVSLSRLPIRVPAELPSLDSAMIMSDGDRGAVPEGVRLARCLINRTVVQPAGRIVMDSQRHPFDTWVVKGRVSVRL